MYAIKLRSRYTGEEIWLGSQYKSRDIAKEYADKELCSRCNSIDIHDIGTNKVWVNKQYGFSDKRR